MPPRLNRLFCNDNQLTALPVLPDTLSELICNNNQITVLPILPKSLRAFSCSKNNIIQIDSDLSSLNIYIKLNTNDLNLDSLKKYKEYLIRISEIKRLPQNEIQPILDNIDKRIDLKNFQIVSGKTGEINVSGTNETIQRGNMDLIKSYITDRKGGRKSRKGKKSRKSKRSRNGRKCVSINRKKRRNKTKHR